MDNSQLGVILKEFEPFFKCHLEPDSHDSCLIKMGLGISIQIEIDRYGYLLIGCRVGTIPIGRFRDNVLKQALKSNEFTLPSTGILGFSQKTHHLILFIKMNPTSLTPDQIQAQLPPFIKKAKRWVDAIAKGEIPPIDQESKSGSPSGLFSLISKGK
jgi:hypothetical protein